MKKIVILIAKILAGLLAGLVILLGIAFAAFHTDAVQDHLVQKATEMLADHLQTHVSIKKASVSFIDQGVRLYGVEIEDRQKRKMFQMRELGIDIDLLRLFKNEVKVSQAKIRGLEARLYKPASDSDSVANYKFVLEAFKHKKTKKDTVTVTAEKPKHQLNVDVNKVYLDDIKFSYNDTTNAQLGSLLLKSVGKERYLAEVRELKTAFVKRTKKGPVDTRLRIGALNADKYDGQVKFSIDSFCYQTDNHQPRKNVGKPNRGAFDVGHFDVVAKLSGRIDSIGSDTLLATINNCEALDRGSGLAIKSMSLKVAANKRVAHLSDIAINMANTSLSIPSAELQLPSKKEQRPLAYQTSLIKGRVLLKDIAKPFAPVLSRFSLPLNLQVRMSGDDQSMRFRDIAVSTTDKKLTISAIGRISNLKDKYRLNVHFDVHRMTALGGSKERVISQFPVKKFMMKQLHALGRIDYVGHFDVFWKKEQFSGRLGTEVGQMDFQFALDELNKYVYGTTHTDSLELGKAMDMPDLGKIACKANFKFDISKPRTAKMRQLKGGKLPIGHVDAEVAEGSYKRIKVHNLIAEIESDGAVATGKVTVKGKRVDLLCGFSFTNTNEMKKTKIKPGIRFHKMSDEDKAKREERRALKAEEKAERRAAKAEEKAARKAAKAEEKAAKAEEKAARKAAKAEEKAARKAAKEAEKAARKAAKAANETNQE